MHMEILEVLKKIFFPFGKRMSFFDEKGRLRMKLRSSSVVYIKSEANYVNVFYVEWGKLKHFMLRTTMKSLKSECLVHGLFRCHRSYYVNPKRITSLHRENSKVMYAEMKAPEPHQVPVAVTYYESLAEIC